MSRKQKFLTTLFSITICTVMICVSVYASLSQTANVNGTISVTTDGQIETAVQVYKGTAASSGEKYAGQALTYGGTAFLTKDASTTSATTELSTLYFAGDYNVNAHGLKVVITNTQKQAVGYTVGIYEADGVTPLSLSNQMKIYVGTTEGAALATSFSGSLPATNNATATVYVIIALDVALNAITYENLKNFRVVVDIVAI